MFYQTDLLFGVGDYVLSNRLTFLHNQAHYIGLEALILTKQLLLTVSTTKGP